ncbi:uncharacterized protein LOC133892086 [Phragmites australis]|uniref:uncharacterized protein LOC133892086 n=1 Tax=Phragmites australis TaxID=29695 RepID=UPI002D782395|nr:uncharacterized protein LOC133892086 [Phragmites australis]
MGCAGSKAGSDVAVADVYRPPSTSVSLFDISAVEEPWLIATNKSKDADGDEAEDEDDEETDGEEDDEDEKPTNTVVPLPLLDKLDGFELAPASWSEVSKALEDMKPALNSKPANTKPPPPKKKKKKKKQQQLIKQEPVQAQQPPQQQQQLTQTPSLAAADEVGKKAPLPTPALGTVEAADRKPPPPELTGRRIVKDNPFLMRDRENKGNVDGAPKWKRRDPFEGCPERRPPGAAGGGVVLYTTTLRGVRRTFEDCERARELVEACAAAAGVEAVDERDVSLHGEYLRELRELAGEGAAPPRLFVMGRYVGGAGECAQLAESGKLREMMRWAKARGEACAAKDGRGCEGCGGARFVPCWECGGSCKVVVGGAGGEVVRCGKCNENGLMMCPICH